MRIEGSIIILSLTLAATSAAQQADTSRVINLDEVVVSASKIEEGIAKAPVSIEKVTLSAIQRSAAPTFFDGLENVKGIQMITPSMGFKVINMRGFANTTNVRFVQLVDGMDNQAPHIGAPIANSLGPSDLDIESVEIVPGVGSALYGMNAINGLANFITRDPFKSTGLSIQQKTGVNRIGTEGGAQPFSETSLRWAQVVHNRFAYKINGTFLTGNDWVANDMNDLNPNANSTTGLKGADNPGMDPVNSYGNESPNQKTLSLGGKNYVVARTGYAEKDVVDYGIRNIKSDASLNYLFRPDIRLTYLYKYANVNTVYQRANRFRLDDYQLQQHGLVFQSKSLVLRTYLTLENTGKSYNARSMAENIDNSFKPTSQWFSDYSKNYQNAIAAGSSVSDAHHLARQQSDAGRPVPGTEGFNDLIGQLRDINNWDYGAALRVKSRLFHTEGQFNFTRQMLHSFHEKTGVDLLAGFDHRTYIIIPDGNYFINPTDPGKDLYYSKTGGFVQAAKDLFSEKLRLIGTLRADKNDYYSVKYNPRMAAIYSPSFRHNIRMSYQQGYRFPSIFEAFSNVNSGGVKRVGGLPVMSHGIFENAYLRNSIDAFQRAVTSDINTQGMSRSDAILKEELLIRKNDYTYFQPEHIRSLEVGYRSSWFNNALDVDIDFYFNRYDNFIGQVEMNIPKTSNPDSVAFYLADKTKQDRYRMYTNSKTVAYNYGSTVGVKYRMSRGFMIGGNLTYANLQRKSNTDGFEDGFNTPKWMTNLSLGNDKIFRTLGFMVTYRWQTSYYWQSFLVNGNVPAYQTVDGQLSFTVDKFRLKFGGTNIFNRYYRSFLGGPSVGGFYYSSVTFNL